MGAFRRGEVVLVAFPFAGSATVKRRPALILLDAGDEDVVVARITSQPVRGEWDTLIDGWQQAGLLAPSIARLHKLATLEKRLVERTLGSLAEKDLISIESALGKLWLSGR